MKGRLGSYFLEGERLLSTGSMVRGTDSTRLPHESSVPTDWHIIMMSHIILKSDILLSKAMQTKGASDSGSCPIRSLCNANRSETDL